MTPFCISSDSTIVGGLLNDVTWRTALVKDSLGTVIGSITEQFDYRNTNKFWYWKESELIRKAHDTYRKGSFNEAKELYERAYLEHPKHGYLKTILEHLNYMATKSEQDLIDQYVKHSGTYGQRQFFVRDNKFYYKRQWDNGSLPKLELLPVNENTYMDFTRLGSHMVFKLDSTGIMASTAYHFNTLDGTFEWREMTEGNNYFLKEN